MSMMAKNLQILKGMISSEDLNSLYMKLWLQNIIFLKGLWFAQQEQSAWVALSELLLRKSL